MRPISTQMSYDPTRYSNGQYTSSSADPNLNVLDNIFHVPSLIIYILLLLIDYHSEHLNSEIVAYYYFSSLLLNINAICGFLCIFCHLHFFPCCWLLLVMNIRPSHKKLQRSAYWISLVSSCPAGQRLSLIHI